MQVQETQPPKETQPHLFSPLTLKNRTPNFQNRIWVSPMCQYSATDGRIGDWHHAHLTSFITGLPGLVMVEATAVTPQGRISIACPDLRSDENANAFTPIISFAHKHNVKMGIQLAHAGRKASTMRPWDDHLIASPQEGGWQPISASPIAYPKYQTPHAISIAEIHQLIRDYQTAAKRAVNAGFDLIEIHAAHGYLIHQFYSPLTNQRTDDYGGSFENRIRLLLEITKAIREVIPQTMPLFVRISASDWVPGGWDISDSIQLAQKLKPLGIDLIDVSSGGNSPDQKIELKPGYQVHFSEAIKSQADIPTVAVGLITEPEQAQEIIATHKADAVMLARAMLRNPRWPLHAATKLNYSLEWPVQLMRGK